MDEREFKDQVRDFARSPIFERLFSTLEANYVQAWKNASDPGVREEIHRMLKAAEALKSEITYLSEDARIKSYNRRLSGTDL